MRSFLKNAVATLICLSGMPILIREWVCRKRVAILMYHDPKPTVFEKHIAYLSRRWTVISLDTLAAAIHRKDFSQIPPKSVVITIDDGHAGNIALLPIFKQHSYPSDALCLHTDYQYTSAFLVQNSRAIQDGKGEIEKGFKCRSVSASQAHGRF